MLEVCGTSLFLEALKTACLFPLEGVDKLLAIVTERVKLRIPQNYVGMFFLGYSASCQNRELYFELFKRKQSEMKSRPKGDGDSTLSFSLMCWFPMSDHDDDDYCCFYQKL